MKLLKRSLMLATLMIPGVLNAALLRFDVAATAANPLYPLFDSNQNVGLFDGSYFVIDTSVINTSTSPTSGQFVDSIVAGHIETYDPEHGTTIADITDERQGTINTTNDGLNTTWEIIASSEDGGQSATTLINFSGTSLFNNLDYDDAYYNDAYIIGTVTASALGREMTIDFTQFEVTDVTPAPVPLPPTVYLMASALGLMLWRSNLSVTQVKQLLTS